jgi:TRAP-type C4-dicarboxylate transport system substrate-binding protein
VEGFIGMGTTKEPKNLDNADLAADKGIKIRTASMQTLRTCWEDMGYEAITVAYNEVPTAIQTNVVEGWVGGTPNMNYAWVGELLSHMFVNYAHAEATSYVVSQKTLDKLTDEDKALVTEAFQEISMKSFDAAEENERNFMNKLEADYGVIVVEDSMERREEIAAFVREVTWPGLEELMGAETIQGCRDDLAKLG